VFTRIRFLKDANNHKGLSLKRFEETLQIHQENREPLQFSSANPVLISQGLKKNQCVFGSIEVKITAQRKIKRRIHNKRRILSIFKVQNFAAWRLPNEIFSLLARLIG
jgi:hypothetical protein